jgi:hypothetical protein
MLDTIRYMIVWFPLVFLIISMLAKMFPHHHVTRHIAVAAHGPHAAGAGLHHHGHGHPGAAAGVSPSLGLLQQHHQPDAVDVGAIAAGAH